MKKRYQQASRQEKGQLLNEMEHVTGRHRKSLIRLLQGDLQRHARRRERGRTYKSDVDVALRVIWAAAMPTITRFGVAGSTAMAWVCFAWFQAMGSPV